MKKYFYFLLAGLIIALAGCSTLIDDLINLKEEITGPKYTVEYYTQTLESCKTPWNTFDDVQKEEKGGEEAYKWTCLDILTKTLHGKAGELTAAELKSITGFELSDEKMESADEYWNDFIVDEEGNNKVTIKQQEIAEDGSTVVKVYYKRLSFSSTFVLGTGTIPATETTEAQTVEGVWKKGSDDKEDKTGDFWYEDAVTVVDGLKPYMKQHVLKGWTSNGGVTVVTTEELPETQGAENVVWTAVWELKDGIEYRIEHYYQNVALKYDDPVVETDYCAANTLTKAAPKLKEGFELSAADGKNALAEDGTTVIVKQVPNEGDEDNPSVVKIYYDRILYTVKFDLNDPEAMWNYTDWKASSDPDFVKDIEPYDEKAAYGVTLPVPDFSKLGKPSYNFKGWNLNGGTDLISNAELTDSENPLTVPAGDSVYTAVWEEKLGATVTVEHYKPTVRSVEKPWSTLTEEEKAQLGDMDELKYSWVIDEEKINNCKPETLTNVEAKNYTGMSLEKPIVQKVVADDDSTVIYVYYKRNEYTVTFALDGGAWDYTTAKTDTENKTVTQVYGLAVKYPSFATIGKKTFKADGWMAQSGEETPVAVATADLPVTMGPANVTYTANWVTNDGIAYTVRHHYQNVALTGYDHDMASDDSLTGTAETVPEISKKVLTGFEFAEEKTGAIPEIAADGKTVIDIYYNRLMFNVTYQINGGYWDYKTNKDSASDQADKVIDAAFGAAIATPDTANMGYKGHRLTGWSKDNGTTIVQFEDLVKLTQPAQNVVYKAIWAEATGVPYTVNHYRKTVAAYVKAWANLTEQEKIATGKTEESYTYDVQTETLFGNADDPTAATLKNYGVGFELAKEGNALDGTTPVINQGVINDDESTVVNIYYDRVTFSTTYKLDGGTWDYTTNGASGNKADVERRTIFEREINKPSFLDVGKTSMKLKGWKLEDDSTVIATASLPAIQADHNVVYVAVWEENTVNYTVETYLQNVENNEFTLESSETLEGLAETETAVTAPEVTGFTASPVTQKKIDKNGTTVIQIQYVRNTYDVEYDVNGGVWNWSKVQTGEIEDTAVKQYKAVKFGADLPKPAMNDMYRIKYVFEGWSADGGATVVSSADLPAKVGSENITYVARWKLRGAVNYTVKHLFEKVDDTDYESNSSYKPEIDKGEEGELTKAATLVKTVEGFEAQPVTETKITVEGVTVEIKYNRVVRSVTFDLNGGAWNYTAYKANKDHVTPDTESEVISGKFGAPVVLPSFTGVGKSHSNLVGWVQDGDSRRIIDPEGPFVTTIQAADVVYQAEWVYDGGTPYTVKHAFEAVDGTFVVDESKNVAMVGDAGELTEAAALSADKTPGYTPKAITQVEVPEVGVTDTVVIVEYTRNTYDFTFDGNGGNWSGATTKTASAKFGLTVEAGSIPAAPVRANWTFGGWTNDGGKTVLTNDEVTRVEMPVGGATFTAYWVGTTTVAEPSVYGDVTLTATGRTGGINVAVTIPAGSDPARWTYTWYLEGVKYDSLTAASGAITSTPGKRTVTVVAQYTRSDGSKDPARTKQQTVTVSK